MIVVTFSSLKGGTGKSSSTILTANCLAAAGKKVLVIDADINNSCSFFYLPNSKEAEKKNLAFALQGNNLLEFTIKTENPNIDIIPSSLNLINLRAMSTGLLKSLLPTLDNTYDVVLCDTAPTYDNIVLNCINASDCVITPVNYNQFDYNTSVFLSQKLRTETQIFDDWYLLFNRHEVRYDNNPNSLQNQYLELFKQDSIIGSKIVEPKIPNTHSVRKAIDTKETIKPTGNTEKLYKAITAFCSLLLGEKITPKQF